MKFGVAICGEHVPKPSEAAEQFYNQGIKTVELGYNRMFTPEEVRKLKEFNIDFSIHCSIEGFRFKCFLPSILFGSPTFYIPKCVIREVERGFSVAQELEATHYVLHGGVFPKGYFRFKRLRNKVKLIEAFTKSFKPLFLKSKDCSVKIVLENLTKGNIFSEVSEIVAVKNKFPWLGFCLDFAHSELTRQTDSFKKMRIDHIHVSDNDMINDVHLQLGTGKMDFIKLKRIIEEQKFDGKLLAECPNVDNAINSLKYLEMHSK